MSVDQDLAYDAWRTREPDPDYEGEARERWEDGVYLVELLGAEMAHDLLWDAYAGVDIREKMRRLMDQEWEDQKKHWEDLSYGL